ncbi:lipoate--protein ligase family protein [Domibacillus epiphyticus]|uniref:Octanoyl-[GcvH]:protein N-octanoyltransferase n=1 Tax=Domibacillus epiphyticus TaxID=1714355 RepID=A0A1V2A6C7_9BACI|nr:lipoate--protein ligase family protein [Domibacillus epiphyticus]OMP66551.1 octanoyltransferase [Domibacillus epiphyticus]
MDQSQDLLRRPVWRFIDQSAYGPGFNPIHSFAADDALCTAVGAGKSPSTVRTWVHHDTVVLGIQDTKLPFLKEGIQVLKDFGYHVIVRNSGGLAVMLDEGVLNLSLIMPDTEKGIDIDRGYEAMYALVRRMFPDQMIDAYEIVGSYCPGSYDLSIGGKKFAGISQRRLRKGVVVQIYLCVTGSGAERAAQIREFYEAAKQGAETKWVYPDIQPDVMASLAELIGIDLTIEDVIVRFLHSLKEIGGPLDAGATSPFEADLFDGYLDRMVERNERAFG